MYIAILGRQPAISIAELERMFGGLNVKKLTPLIASVKTDDFNIQKLGSILKAGKVTLEIESSDWRDVSQKIIKHYIDKWSKFDGKITLGLSVYEHRINPREIQKIGITLKQVLKKSGTSIRIIPNNEQNLNTATSHHNKLGLAPNKVELLIVRANNKFYVAESTGAQNITAYAKRDQERPKRDAFVGMLPPKLAQIMVNFACSQTIKPGATILDPFCGTGVVLQESLIAGYNTYGTDLSDKMIDYSEENLRWLNYRNQFDGKYELHQGDAMKTKWQQPIDAVACESYLGQPFSAPPSPAKLQEVKDNCNHIITEFLKNIAPQIKSGTPLCIAIPAWRDTSGQFTRLPLVDTIARIGFKPHEFVNVRQNDLLYYREDQIVARELLVLTKI
jgi:tRNA (guanine10-N2)-dimethyltransferase